MQPSERGATLELLLFKQQMNRATYVAKLLYLIRTFEQ